MAVTKAGATVRVTASQRRWANGASVMRDLDTTCCGCYTCDGCHATQARTSTVNVRRQMLTCCERQIGKAVAI
jgi:hypothetical protein